MVINACTLTAASSVVSIVSPKSAYEKPTPTLTRGGQRTEHCTSTGDLRLIEEENVGLVVPGVRVPNRAVGRSILHVNVARP